MTKDIFNELPGLNIVVENSRVRIGRIVQQLYLKFPNLANDSGLSTQRFLAEKQDASFVGREDILRTLDDWLEAPNAPSSLLLFGPAGRGKSATLVQWLARLKAKGEQAIPVIFVPISRRHTLARSYDFFPALSASLAAFLPATVPLPDDVDQMRSYAQRALGILAGENQPLLVIIDGLDEADGWSLGPEFFPLSRPGNGLRIVIGARIEADDPAGEEWRRRLGLENSSTAVLLPPLTTENVG